MNDEVTRGVSRPARLLLVALVAVGLLVTGCSSSGGSDKPSPSSYAGVRPQYPTLWMQQVTVDWRKHVESGTTFASVIENGRVWTGDPRQYEQVCGASFLIDGTTPDLNGGIDGQPPSANPDPTYYEWLQADPKRWSAFNAWLYDPAIVALLDQTPENKGKTRADRIGSTQACPNAAQAGTPVG